MPAVLRPVPFVLAASNHGTMIVSRHDYHMTAPNVGYGVGFQILQNSSFDPVEIDLAVLLLRLRQYHNGDGVVGLDCGANIGVHTVEWARAMTGWGEVLAFEAQERGDRLVLAASFACFLAVVAWIVWKRTGAWFLA